MFVVLVNQKMPVASVGWKESHRGVLSEGAQVPKCVTRGVFGIVLFVQ